MDVANTVNRVQREEKNEQNRRCVPACLLRSKLERTLAREKASFLPWWGQKNPVGQVGLGPQG